MLQRGPTATAELVSATTRAPDRLVFDFSVRVVFGAANASVHFIGPFAQGPPSGRFVYLSSGQAAHDLSSRWRRRAKIALDSITPAQVVATLDDDQSVLEAVIEGTGRDGGPVCAMTRPPDGWRLVPRAR